MDIITYGLLNKKKANINSPHFTGEPTAPTPDLNDSSEKIATTEYVQNAVKKGGSNTTYKIEREGSFINLIGSDDTVTRAELPYKCMTTAEWSQKTEEISEKDFFYIYTDWRTSEDGIQYAGVKIGDGLAYIVDLPFQNEDFLDHILNSTIHITQEERDFWNNKVRCYMVEEDNENLFFTTH